MNMRQRICARWGGTVQHQTKDFCFVALNFSGLLDHDILIDYELMMGII